MSTPLTRVKPASHRKQSYFSNWDRNLLSLTHELSGPLTAAKLNLEKYISSKQKHSLELLADNLKLMEDYLVNSRQHIKRQPMPARPFSVNKQLAEIIKNLSPVAAQRSVALGMDVIDDCALRGNATRFKQIISCFIRNAIEAYDGCNHANKTVLIEHYHIEDYLVISVRDHGNGIAEQDKAKIFKPYFSTKRAASGLGIGLSLAAESIGEDFQGKVEVISDKSNGSLFSLFFRLPAKSSMLK